MRQQGILRLMRTTPVTRLTFVLAQVAARLAIGVGITLVALLVTWAVWDVTVSQLAAALRQNLGVGGPALFPLWVDCAVLLAVTVAVTFLAVRLFRWDLAEQSYRGEGTTSSA